MVHLVMSRNPETISISEFKAKSLALLERVRRTGRPLVVTKRGRPIAEVIPPTAETLGTAWIGSAKGTARLQDDLIAPAAASDEWEVIE